MSALPTARKVDFSEVPVIDLSPLKSGDSNARLKLAKSVSKSCREVGFLYLINHGIKESEIDLMFKTAERFFALPIEHRMEVVITRSRSWRGFLPMDLNTGADTRLKKNLQEAFQIRAEPAKDDPDFLANKILVGPNQWPSAMPDLEPIMMNYYKKVRALANDIISLLALGLDLDTAVFQALFDKPDGMLRLLHYPPQAPEESGGRLGTRAHTDTGAVTILAQDTNGGLQVMNRMEEWIEVPPVPGSFVVNIGEMMKILTDGIYRSTPHRVINRSGAERYSVPFFYSPNVDALVRPVIANPDTRDGPEFESSYPRDTAMTCGEIYAKTYARIWPAPQVAA